MAYVHDFEVKGPYLQPAGTYKTADSDKYDSAPLMQWPSNNYFSHIKKDASFITESLLKDSPANNYIADKVFGMQKNVQSVNLKHTANLLYERCRLHKLHLDEIEKSHLDVQARRFGAQINNFPDRAKQLSNLESQLLQLDQQRREEELSFWKDTVELRSKLLEQADQYKTASNRLNLFSSLEYEYGKSL